MNDTADPAKLLYISGIAANSCINVHFITQKHSKNHAFLQVTRLDLLRFFL